MHHQWLLFIGRYVDIELALIQIYIALLCAEFEAHPGVGIDIQGAAVRQ